MSSFLMEMGSSGYLNDEGAFRAQREQSYLHSTNSLSGRIISKRLEMLMGGDGEQLLQEWTDLKMPKESTIVDLKVKSPLFPIEFIQIPLETGDIFVQSTPVTVFHYESVMGELNPGGHRDFEHYNSPIVSISSREIQYFIDQLNFMKSNLPIFRKPLGKEGSLRLPHRGEWLRIENFIRSKLGLIGNGTVSLPTWSLSKMWLKHNSSMQPKPVGIIPPQYINNSGEIYDFYGNVSEAAISEKPGGYGGTVSLGPNFQSKTQFNYLRSMASHGSSSLRGVRLIFIP